MIQRFSSKPWTQRFYIHCVQRENNSAQGNPRWLLHVGLADQVTTVLRTEPDNQLNHQDLSALEHTVARLTIVSGVVTAVNEGPT